MLSQPRSIIQVSNKLIFFLFKHFDIFNIRGHCSGGSSIRLNNFLATLYFCQYIWVIDMTRLTNRLTYINQT